jgi:hypothetical protein
MGDFVSIAKYGDVADDYGQAVVVDGGRNVIIAGSVTTVTGASHPFVGKQSSAGTLMWSNILSGNGFGSAQAVAVDGAGNVFVTGYFMGTLDLGGAELTSTYGSYNIFVAKFSADGAHQWSKRFGTSTAINSGNESGNGIAVDPRDSSVVVTGSYDSDADFGNGPMPQSPGQSLFLVKFSGDNGTCQWSRGLKSAANTAGNAVAIDASGNIYLTGGIVTYMNLNATMDFGNGAVPVTNSVMFVAKYTSTGGYAWAKQFGSSAEGRAIAVAGNNVAVVGRYQLSINFGGQTLTNAPSSNPLAVLPNSIFVANLSASSGAHNWSKSFGVGLGTGAAAGANGNITLTGAQGMIANLAADGTTRWTKTLVGPAQCSAVATDADGYSYVIGNLRTTVDFGGGPVTSTGRSDIFLLQLAK